MRRACQITLNDAGRLILERWSDGRSTQARLVSRAARHQPLPGQPGLARQRIETAPVPYLQGE